MLVLFATAQAAPSPHEALLGWVSSMPGAVLGPVKVSTSTLGIGIGLVLSRAVEENEVLFVVPAPAIITLQTATEDPVLGAQLSKLRAQETDRAALAGFLAHQILNPDDSRYMPYLATLPPVSAPPDLASHAIPRHAAASRGTPQP